MANIASINGNPIVVGTSGISDNSITDAKLVQDGGVLSTVATLKSTMETLNASNLLDDLTHLDMTNKGITWTWDGSSCTVSGTATATANNDMFSSSTTMPGGFTKGETYYIRYYSSKINLRIYVYPNSGSLTEIYSAKESGTITIPSNAVGMIIRLNIPSGTVVNETIEPIIVSAFSNKELQEGIDALLYRCVDEITVGLFEKGGVVNGVDSSYGKNGRIRTGMLYALNDIQMIADTATYPNARIGVQTFGADGAFLADSGWKTEHTITKGTIFRTVLTRVYTDASTEFSASDIFGCFSQTDLLTTSSRVIALASTDRIAPLFEHGGLESGVNNSYNANARARTTDVLVCDRDIFVKHNNGVYGIHFFEDGAFVKATSWLDYSRVIPANTEFRLVVTPNATSSTYTTLDAILACIDVRLVDNYEYGQNPNVLYQARNVDDAEFPPYSKWYIQAAAANQYDRIRVNIRATSDGHYVLIHNTTINSEARNSDGTAISETISSNGQTLATLNSYDWGIKYGSKYAGYGVPTLEEACEYAAMYNLGMTIEVSFWATDEQIDEIAEIIHRYGLLESLIVIAVDSHIWGFSHWTSINDYISVQVAGDITYLTEHVSDINSYKTDKNTVYVGVLPWPSVADDSIRALAFANSWKLYCGMVMDKEDLFDTVGFDKGYSIVEANNIYRIKDTIRDYANAQIDS